MADVCKEYGGGLYLLAAETGSEEVYLKQLLQIKTILDENPDYVRLLSSPAISSSEKRDLITKAFKGKAEEYIVNFMLLMCDMGYFGYVTECIEFFKKTYYEKRNIYEGIVRSAVLLSESEKERIVKALEEKLGGGKTLIMEFYVDESLLGGLYVEVDGKVFDSTVKTKLSGMKNILSKPM